MEDKVQDTAIVTEPQKLSSRAKLVYALLLMSFVAAATTGAYFWDRQQKATRAKASKETSASQKSTSGLAATATTIEPRGDYEKGMVQAAKEYWRATYGDDGAEILLKNYGCHAAVEAVKDGKTIGRLSYDGKSITEIKI